MAHKAFPNLAKSTTVSSGATYAYVHVAPKAHKPYLLFVHGYPSSSYDWRYQIAYFQEQGYGLIVPDLLGYGGTSKPLEKEAYRMKKMSEEVIGLLDAEDVSGGVVGVGHDWGSGLLSRLWNYYPERFSKLCFMDIGYWAPSSEPFSVDAFNEATAQILGYPIFEYWHFFNAEDAGPLLDRNPACTNSLWYGPDPLTMKTHMCPPGAARQYIESQIVGPIAPWLPAEELAMHDAILADGGYGPPCLWYKAMVGNVNLEDERGMPEERKRITVPTLVIGATKDPVGVAAMQVQGAKEWADDLKVVEMATGHWNILEGAEETNKALRKFVEE